MTTRDSDRVVSGGPDLEFIDEVWLPLLRALYKHYFRVEARIEAIPAEGGAIVVPNHSGVIPLDALMLQVAVRDHHPAARNLRLLGGDLVFELPIVSELARAAGHVRAAPANALSLLSQGELVGVMPEGYKGTGKRFSERYKLQRLGRGGFAREALRARVPIVPCAIVGAEEIYPMIGNWRWIARELGLPYFPITPTFPWFGPLGAVPLPTKWAIEVGKPIPTDGYPPDASSSPEHILELADRVRDEIERLLHGLLARRRSIFF